jgi:soluble lytic murein transglycosylase-like protein
MLALAATLALVGGAATAGAQVITAEEQPSIERLKAVTRPAKRLGLSIERYRREQLQRLQSSSQVLGVPRATLEAIAACESGGDPGSVSTDGSYRGKYQFDYGTWASVGGEGDPAAAPEYEQDRRAALLYDRTGGSAWPICG